jgi:RNA recognition motif-containing protein
MKIFIGNLGDEITTTDIIELFTQYGELVSACVAKDENGNNRGFGYVRMKEMQHGELAIKALDRKRFMQQYLTVAESLNNNSCCEKVA